jgi:hypothetical protein
MRIRSGFVSNSSSTSFLVISRGALTKKKLRDLMGVEKGSPLTPLIDQLCADLLDSVSAEIDLGTIKNKPHWKTLLGGRSSARLTDRMLEKLDGSKRRGMRAYYGHLDSETSPVQTFFCMDSFEEENDEVYLNGLECAW